MARVSIVSLYAAATPQAILEGQGHVVTRMPTDCTVDDVVLTTPDVVMCPRGHVIDDVKLMALHDLGYPIIYGAGEFVADIGITQGTNFQTGNMTQFKADDMEETFDHEIFTLAGVPVSDSVPTFVGDGYIGMGAKRGYEIANRGNNTCISVALKGSTTPNVGNTLEADVIFNGLLNAYETDTARQINNNHINILNACVEYLSRNRVTVSGVTLDETGSPVACDIRINKYDRGLPVGVVTSDALTGAYSVTFTEGASYMTCFSPNPLTEPLCLAIEDGDMDAVVNFDFSTGDIVEPIIITSIVAGNVKKLGVPYGAKVVVMSDSLLPKVVGYGDSSPITGDYSIDVAPYTGGVMIAVVPEYGVEFVGNYAVPSADYIIHPTIPNGYVYKAQSSGTLGPTEPVWSPTLAVVSGDVTLDPIMLHRPLMNGFVKPVVTPI